MPLKTHSIGVVETSARKRLSPFLRCEAVGTRTIVPGVLFPRVLVDAYHEWIAR